MSLFKRKKRGFLTIPSVSTDTSPLRLSGDDPLFHEEENSKKDNCNSALDKSSYKSIMNKLRDTGRHTTPFLHPSGGQSMFIPAKCVHVNDGNSIWVAFPMFGSSDLTSIIKLRLEGIKVSKTGQNQKAKNWLKEKIEQKIILVRFHPGFDKRHKPLKDDSFVATIFAFDGQRNHGDYQNFIEQQNTSFLGSINHEMITYNCAEAYTHPNPHEVLKEKREKKKKTTQPPK